MMFKASDVVSYLNEIYKYKGWYNLTFTQNVNNRLIVKVSAPAYLAGSKKDFILDRQKGVLVFNVNGDESVAIAEIKGTFKAHRFALLSDGQQVFSIEPFNTVYSKSELHAKTMVQVVTAKTDAGFDAAIKLSYTPALQKNFIGRCRFGHE